MTARVGAPEPTLEGRRFAAEVDVEGGEVGAETIFEFHEDNGVVWATYAGGDVVKGFLVGTRTQAKLDFRYCQLNRDGETSTGHSVDVVDQSADGRLRLVETWQWESRPGSGTSVPEEL